MHFTSQLLVSTCCCLVAGNSVTGESSLVQGVGAGVFAGDGAGVVEIKCPFNKGDPNSATPPKLPQWYYMPQVSKQTRQLMAFWAKPNGCKLKVLCRAGSHVWAIHVDW